MRATDERVLTISWLDCAVSTIAFVTVLLFFWGMSAVVAWPNIAAGWDIAVIVAAVVAVLPLLGRTLEFLKQNKASLETPLGFKLDFTQAIRASESRAALSPLTVQQVQAIAESGHSELEAAAAEAGRHHALVIDLEEGHAWYLTRVFAVAAMARPLGNPQYLIFLGQRDGRARQALGYVASDDLVRAVVGKEAAYGKVLRRAEKYLAVLRDPTVTWNNPPPDLPSYATYKYVFDQVGDAIFMRILVDQLINPDPGTLDPGEASPETGPPWVDAAQLEQRLAEGLIKEKVDLDRPADEHVATILDAKGPMVLAVRNGTYEGIIEVDLFMRHLLRQLSQPVAG